MTHVRERAGVGVGKKEILRESISQIIMQIKIQFDP